MLAEAYGRTKVGLRKLYNQLGDWGLVAKACRSSQSMMSKPNALTVTKVFNTFHLIAKESGKDSQEKKKNHPKGLLVAASDCEPLYLICLLQANLRIGLAEQTLLAALGQAAVYAHSTPPPNIQSPLDEILSTRARKEVALEDIKVEVRIFAFDMLYLNGQPLLQEQLKVCREHLYGSFEEETGYFQFANAITSNDLDKIQEFLYSAVDASCEGLIIKTLTKDATYEPAKQSLHWLKLKKDYMENLGDSLDLVPIATFHGKGKHIGN